MQVVVGGGETSKSMFYVHETLLRTRSPFFEAALSKSWREGKDGRVKLPDDDADLVKVYLQFLYSGRISIPPMCTAAGLKCDDHESVYFALAGLYALGEKLMDIKLKNQVIEEIFVNAWSKHSSSEQRRPSASVVDKIYGSTAAGSPARRLMVDIYFWKGKKDWMLERPEDNNTEFLMDLTQLLLRRTDRRLKRLIGDEGPDPFDKISGDKAYREEETARPSTSKKRKANLSSWVISSQASG